MDPVGFISVITTWAIPVLIAVTLHEAAHGYVANYLGDPTARLQGRISLNPLVHIDWFGTILLPILMFLMAGFIFGYAKPVPVNARNFKNPRVHMGVVAAAGPLMNLLLALIAVALFSLATMLPGFVGEWFANNLINFLRINCLLIVLNLIPLPPLDGSRMMAAILPLPLARYYMRVEPWGIMILVAAFFVLPMAGRIFGLSFDLVGPMLLYPAQNLAQFLVSLFGYGV